MSWDVYVMKCAEPPPLVAELRTNFATDLMGSAEEIRAAISMVLPSVDWSDPSWGVYDGDGFSFEFCLGRKPLIEFFSILVRGSGNPIALLLELASRNAWYMMDIQTPEWLHHSPDVSASWRSFQEWRDRAIKRSGGESVAE